MPRPKTRPPANQRAKVTVEISLDLYTRWTDYLDKSCTVRNSFVVNAIEDRLASLSPDHANPAERL